MGRPKKIIEPKRGRLSEEEKKQIGKMIEDGYPVKDIAEWTHRSEKQIGEFAARFYGVGENLPARSSEIAEHVRSLRNRPEWKFVEDSFSSEEQFFYEYQYGLLMEQFKDNILPTEEMQIFLVIDNVIYMNRHKRELRMANEEILRLDRLIKDEMFRDGESEESKTRILVWEAQMKYQQDRSKRRTEEWEIYAKRVNDTLSQLKATRAQRVTNIENSKQSFVALIKTLQDKKIRDREGRHMELRRIAGDQAREKLMQPHRYINGEWDQPLLTPENVLVTDSPTPVDDDTLLQISGVNVEI